MDSLQESPELNVLLVEDDENDQLFIERAFTRSGVPNRVKAVPDGEAAVAYLRGIGPAPGGNVRPRLIITDLKMPKMGGIDLLAWLAREEAFRQIPAIVLTSSNDQADIAMAYRHGAKGYMIKPVEFAKLEETVRNIAAYWQASCVPIVDATE